MVQKMGEKMFQGKYKIECSSGWDMGKDKKSSQSGKLGTGKKAMKTDEMERGCQIQETVWWKEENKIWSLNEMR